MSILVPSAAISYTAKAADPSTDWKLGLVFQANNGTMVNSTTQSTFAPFDLVQLIANLTKNDQAVSQATVVFSVKGPSVASFPTEFVRSTETDVTGLANITFRIPFEQTEKSVIGRWQVYVNVKTSNETLQEIAYFQVAYPIQNLAVNFYDTAGHSQTIFNPNDTVKAVIKFNSSNNSSSQSQTQSINFAVQDSAGNTLSHQEQDILVIVNATENEVVYEFKIPENTPFGLATVDLSIYADTYENVSIPAAPNKRTYFSIGNYTAPSPDQTTATPTSSPTPPPMIENTLDLFAWLAIATGLLTFALLAIFLKRKPFPKTNTPNPPPATTTQIGTTKETTPIQTTTAIAQSPTLMTQNMQIQAATQNTTDEDAQTQFLKQQQATVTHLNSIATTTKKIQELQAALNLEKEKLDQDINNLNQNIEEQKNKAETYLDALRNEINKTQQPTQNYTTPKQEKH